MAIKFGANSLSKAYKGASEVQKVYLGGNLVYQLLSDIRGEVVYGSNGTYSWTAPAGVTSVSVVAVGAGGGGTYNSTGFSVGGSGGSLGYKNNIAVVPGQTYTVVVGAAGLGDTNSSSSTSNATSGGNSYFIDIDTVAGLGGPAGGTNQIYVPFVGDGGGEGGFGQPGTFGGSGAGAGGYGEPSGQNSGGGTWDQPSTPVLGAGGAGFADTSSSTPQNGGNGGGVFLYGRGPTGVNGTESSRNGTPGSFILPTGTGARGGGGRGTRNEAAGNGEIGAVRIVWGQGRAFPSTDVQITTFPDPDGSWSVNNVESDPIIMWLDSIGNNYIPAIPGNSTDTVGLWTSNNSTSTPIFFPISGGVVNGQYEGYWFPTGGFSNIILSVSIVKNGTTYSSTVSEALSNENYDGFKVYLDTYRGDM
jgi:hypothetical protein